MKYFHTYLLALAKLALISFLLFVPIQSYGKDVSFQWTANPEPLTGYKLHYKAGASSTLPFEGTGLSNNLGLVEDSPILIDKATTYTVTGLLPDETYHFALTAYNDTGESGYSAIVTVFPDSPDSPQLIPTILNIMMVQ
jgi:hypothetical protein